MLDTMKKKALERAGDVLGSQTAANVMGNPTVQTVLKKAINLRSDVRDGLDRQADEVARKMNLVNKQDLKALKRRIREMESQLAGLQHELKQQRIRTDGLEASLSEATEAAAKAAESAKVSGGVTPRKQAAKKATAKKATAKKATAKRSTAKKSAANKTGAAKKSGAAAKRGTGSGKV